MRAVHAILIALSACSPAPPPPAAAPRQPPPSPPPAPAAETQPHHGAHHAHGPLVHQFDEGPELWAARFEGPERDAYQKPSELVAAMAIEPSMTVVDLGAGTGYFLPHLSAAVPQGRVIALDIEPSFVAHMKQRAAKEGLDNVEVRQVEVDDPGLEAASVDRILIVNTWHHMPSRDAYSAKLARALEPGGEVWVVDFHMDTHRGPAKQHRVPAETIEAELAKAGLATRVDRQLLPDQHIVVGKK